MAGSDVILAAADRYAWPHMRPFVESLRATGYDGEVRFYGGWHSRETVAELERAGVTVVSPRQLRARIRGTIWGAYSPHFARVHWHLQPLVGPVARALALPARDRRGATARLFGALSNVEVARFFWFYLFLRAHVGRYRNVMITDVRDVMFLRNPFAFDTEGTANYFLEQDGDTIGSQSTNRSWILHIYGQQALDELAACPVSCSGITIGAAPAILGYLEAMCDELAGMRRQWMGTDQSAHNMVVHRRGVPGRLVGNSDGPVLTVASMTAGDARALLEARAGDALVVHQYDRHPLLAPMLEELTGVEPGRR